jgi:hypothetical protein
MLPPSKSSPASAASAAFLIPDYSFDKFCDYTLDCVALDHLVATDKPGNILT